MSRNMLFTSRPLSSSCSMLGAAGPGFEASPIRTALCGSRETWRMAHSPVTQVAREATVKLPLARPSNSSIPLAAYSNRGLGHKQEAAAPDTGQEGETRPKPYRGIKEACSRLRQPVERRRSRMRSFAGSGRLVRVERDLAESITQPRHTSCEGGQQSTTLKTMRPNNPGTVRALANVSRKPWRRARGAACRGRMLQGSPHTRQSQLHHQLRCPSWHKPGTGDTHAASIRLGGERGLNPTKGLGMQLASAPPARCKKLSPKGSRNGSGRACRQRSHQVSRQRVQSIRPNRLEGNKA